MPDQVDSYQAFLRAKIAVSERLGFEVAGSERDAR